MCLGSAQSSLTLALLFFLGTFIVPGLRTLEVPKRCLGSNPIDYLTSFISKSDVYHLVFASEIPKLSFEGSIFNPISDEEYSEDEDEETPTLVQIDCVCVCIAYVLFQVSRSSGAHF
ncbi:hypothetical protein B0H14DRAFT_2719734 [Mycena olivaceomarginata]|nr:hypothetical protein B0H14DRAFT_2719734 [Mycena olivaceomarginata]